MSGSSTATAIDFAYSVGSTQRITISRHETSGASGVRLYRPSAMEPWERMLWGGMRFDLRPLSGVVRGGHLSTVWLPDDEVVDIFAEFLQAKLPGQRYDHELLHSPFPRITGWRIDQSGDVEQISATAAAEQTFFVDVTYPTTSAGVFDSSLAASTTEYYFVATGLTAPGAATVTAPRRDAALDELASLIASARDEEFEYGTISDYARRLAPTLDRQGQQGLNALAELLAAPHLAGNEIAMETLRVVGDHERLRQSADVMEFLTTFLAHSLPSMRDAAALALADLGDRRAVGALNAAAAVETNAMIRSSLEQAARELAE